MNSFLDTSHKNWAISLAEAEYRQTKAERYVPINSLLNEALKESI